MSYVADDHFFIANKKKRISIDAFQKIGLIYRPSTTAYVSFSTVMT